MDMALSLSSSPDVIMDFYEMFYESQKRAAAMSNINHTSTSSGVIGCAVPSPKKGNQERKERAATKAKHQEELHTADAHIVLAEVDHNCASLRASHLAEHAPGCSCQDDLEAVHVQNRYRQPRRVLTAPTDASLSIQESQVSLPLPAELVVECLCSGVDPRSIAVLQRTSSVLRACAIEACLTPRIPQ